MKIKVCRCTIKELPELQGVECGTTEKDKWSKVKA